MNFGYYLRGYSLHYDVGMIQNIHPLRRRYEMMRSEVWRDV